MEKQKKDACIEQNEAQAEDQAIVSTIGNGTVKQTSEGFTVTNNSTEPITVHLSVQ